MNVRNCLPRLVQSKNRIGIKRYLTSEKQVMAEKSFDPLFKTGDDLTYLS